MNWRLQAFLLQLLLAGVGLLWLAANGARTDPAWTLRQAEMSAAQAADIGAATALPAAAWRPLDQAELARWRAPYWLRFHIQAPAAERPDAWILSLSLRAASRVYWDGRHLGDNGFPAAQAADEVPGRIDSQFLLDRAMSGSGEHVLLVQASSHRAVPMASADAVARVLSHAQTQREAWRWLVVAFALGAIASALAYWAIAVRAAQPAPARGLGRSWLLALGAVGLVLPLAESWRSLFGYTYDWHATRLILVLGLHAAAALLLPLYLLFRHAAATGRRLVALCAAWVLLLLLAMAAEGYDPRSWTVQFGGLCLALVVCAAHWRQRPEMRPLGGLLLSGALLAVIWPAAFLDGLYVIVLALLMVCLMLEHAAHVRRLGEHQARLGAERDRLRLQLLRRAIQPHWLMNSLTSLQELIEQAPTRASRLVELLAEHFAQLRAHSERDQVALDEELALCRVQLDIAGLVQARKVDLRVHGEVAGIQLPPGILHCLVENGLSHAGFRACAEQGFTLRIERSARHLRLELVAPLAQTRPAPTPGGGTGTRYVRASLARAWPQGASFSDGPLEGRWCSALVFPCAS